MGAFVVRVPVSGVYVRVPDFWNLPYVHAGRHPNDGNLARFIVVSTCLQLVGISVYAGY